MLCRIPDKQKYKMPLHPSVPFDTYSQASDVSRWRWYLLPPNTAIGRCERPRLLFSSSCEYCLRKLTKDILKQDMGIQLVMLRTQHFNRVMEGER